MSKRLILAVLTSSVLLAGGCRIIVKERVNVVREPAPIQYVEVQEVPHIEPIPVAPVKEPAPAPAPKVEVVQEPKAQKEAPVVAVKEKKVEISQEPEQVDAQSQELVSQLTIARTEYFSSLKSLKIYYANVGNNAKLGWAKKEIAVLSTIPLYYYVSGNKAQSNLVGEMKLAKSKAYNPVFQEVDLVEGMMLKRSNYYSSLKNLENYFVESKKEKQLKWLRSELSVFGSVPQYNYLANAVVPRDGFVAVNSIEAADDLYNEAQELNSKGRIIGLPVDKAMLRAALAKYNELINKYPTSDKVDECAYKAGDIYKYFGDWDVAAVYYQRTFQWNPDTRYPARFKAAWMLDVKLDKNEEALVLYKESLEKESRYVGNVELAQVRIISLTKEDGSSELNINDSNRK